MSFAGSLSATYLAACSSLPTEDKAPSATGYTRTPPVLVHNYPSCGPGQVDLAADSFGVYVGIRDDDTGRVERLPTFYLDNGSYGGTPVRFARGYGYTSHLSVNYGRVYWEDGGLIRSCSRDGTECQALRRPLDTFRPGSALYPTPFAFDRNHLLFAAHGPGDKGPGLYRMGKFDRTGSVELVAEFATSVGRLAGGCQSFPSVSFGMDVDSGGYSEANAVYGLASCLRSDGVRSVLFKGYPAPQDLLAKVTEGSVASGARVLDDTAIYSDMLRSPAGLHLYRSTENDITPLAAVRSETERPILFDANRAHACWVDEAGRSLLCKDRTSSAGGVVVHTVRDGESIVALTFAYNGSLPSSEVRAYWAVATGHGVDIMSAELGGSTAIRCKCGLAGSAHPAIGLREGEIGFDNGPQLTLATEEVLEGHGFTHAEAAVIAGVATPSLPARCGKTVGESFGTFVGALANRGEREQACRDLPVSATLAGDLFERLTTAVQREAYRFELDVQGALVGQLATKVASSHALFDVMGQVCGMTNDRGVFLPFSDLWQDARDKGFSSYMKNFVDCSLTRSP